MMILRPVVLLCFLVPGLALGQPSAQDRATSLSTQAAAASTLRSIVSATDMRSGREETTTFILSLDRQKGWRLEGSDGSSTYTVINNFDQDLRLYGARKEALLLTSGGNPELQRLFRKPVTDLDPLTLLDPASLIYKGTDTMDGTTVHRFAGSTTTQFLNTGDPILRRLEVWIGENDGMARRVVESTDGQIAITVYSGLEVNPKLTDGAFSTEPPEGFKVVDVNAQIHSLDASTTSTGTPVSADQETSR